MSSQRSRRTTNGSNPDPGQRRPNGNPSAQNLQDNNRAQQFEDQKRRIIDSCFLKKEPDGALAESYITHIAVVEDATSPSSPPPPTSDKNNKKPRVIIVAVRRSGRVRLHKARENSNATFSIGKTWQLEHLSAIESFNGLTPPSAEEQQRKSWGGETGMLITIQKPYFWQAYSAKEKDFFIGSLVKIFWKYTGGKEPSLVGFSPQELASLSPANGPRPKTPQTNSRASPMPSPAMRPPPSAAASSTSLPPEAAGLGLRPPSAPREGRPRPQDTGSSQETFESAQREFQTPPLSTNRTPSREGRSPRMPLSPPQVPNIPPAAQQQSAEFNPPPAPLRSPERSRVNSARSPVRAPMPPPSMPGPLPSNTAEPPPPMAAMRSPSKPEPPPQPEPEPLKDALPERRRPAIDQTPDNASQPEEQNLDGGELQSPGVAPSDTQQESPADEVQHRPGLGPMIKKKSAKDIAGTFRKAAQAASAFKPRAGGAGERLRNEFNKTSGSSGDGIHGVFHAPSSSGLEGPKSPLPPTPIISQTSTPQLQKDDPMKANTSTTSLPIAPVNDDPPPPAKDDVQPDAQLVVPEVSKAPVPTGPKVVRPTNAYISVSNTLGIDPKVLESRAEFIDEVDTILVDAGLTDTYDANVTAETVKTKIAKDLADLETGKDSLLHLVERSDERYTEVHRLLNEAYREADEMDSLLTLYSAELSTMSEDVAYIEAQSQGLQVQAANQKLLFNELKNLLDTICIPPDHLHALQQAPLSRADGIGAIESSLVHLLRAMVTIDPKLRQRGRNYSSSAGSYLSEEYSTMQAVQENKQKYENECNSFVLRLRDQMTAKFQDAESLTRDNLGRARPSNANTKMNIQARDEARTLLWPYTGLVLFAREVRQNDWESLVQMYQNSVKRLYQSEYRDNFATWKSDAKRAAGEHEDILFTNQEKETEGSLVGRKLTVKRSKTLREGPRVPASDKAQDGKMNQYEAFSGALWDTALSIAQEQNFISDMFHASSHETVDFPDFIASVPPEARRGTDLTRNRHFDPDRNMAKQLQSIMDEMFSFWPTDVQNFVDSIVVQDPLQGIGVLFALESRITDLEDTNQEYIVTTLQQIHNRLITRFDRFVDEQIKAIEDTKVKSKKRKGVITFIKIFPYFVSAVEMMLPSPRANGYPIREKVNTVYDGLNKSMFDTLKVIAKESPVVLAGQKSQGLTGGEAEDKGILNSHILMIQNTNHYSEEVQPQGNPTLENWRGVANRELADHMNQYVSAVVRRPLGKLLDSIESIEAALNTLNAGEGPTTIASKPSHSRSIFKKVLSDYEAKHVRHQIDALKKRVEKHYGEADDPGLSRNLVFKVLQECEDKFIDVLVRTNRIVRDVYEGELEVDFKRDDIHSAFRRN